MKHTLADPKKEWDGFRLTAYRLDTKIVNLPLTRIKETTDGKKKEEPTTVGDIYASLADQHVNLERFFFSFRNSEITTDTEQLLVDGPRFNLEMLQAILSLRNDGANAFECTWFWYDSNSVTDEPMYSYDFFVVYHDRIVRENVSFGDNHGSGFDPSLFLAQEDLESNWRNDAVWREARDRFWHRKFFKETRMGQLMALRSDKPELWFYQDDWRQAETDTALLLGRTFNLLRSIRSLLWVLIVLGIFILIRLWW